MKLTHHCPRCPKVGRCILPWFSPWSVGWDCHWKYCSVIVMPVSLLRSKEHQCLRWVLYLPFCVSSKNRQKCAIKSVVHGPAASALPGSLLEAENQVFPYICWIQICILSRSLGDLYAHWYEKHWYVQMLHRSTVIPIVNSGGQSSPQIYWIRI